MLPLSTSQRIVTVEIGSGDERRWLVLGVTPTAITTLHTMAPQSIAAPNEPGARRHIPHSRRSSRACASPATVATVPAERIALAEHRRGDAEIDTELRRPAHRRVAWLALVVLAAVALVVVALPAAAQTAPAAAGVSLPLAGRRERRQHQLLGAGPDAALLHRAQLPARGAAADDELHAHRHRAVACCARRSARRRRRRTRS